MIIGFDASRAFVREATGTENYSLNLLQALASVDKKNHYIVYLRDVGSVRSHSQGPVSSFLPTYAKASVDKPAGKSSAAVPLEAKRSGIGSPSSRATHYKGWPANFEFKLIQPFRFWTQFGLALETWRNPPDVLFVPAHTLPVLRNRRVKTVVTIHDLGVEYLPGHHKFPQRYYLDLASKYAASRAEAIIAVSEATKRDLVNRYKVSAKRVFVVSEGVETRFFRPQLKSKVEIVKSKYKIKGNYILAVGTVQPRKNLQTLIRAFAEVIQGPVTTFPPASARQLSSKQDQRSNLELRAVGSPSSRATLNYLVIAGKLGWDYEGIVNLPKKLGIDGKVKFLGYTSREDLPALYSGSVVFVAPSLFEGFDLPILEALACGCRVVASDIGPHREIFKKLKTAGSKELAVPMTLVKPKDTDKWTQFLYQYISQYNKRLTLTSEKSRIKAVKEVLASEYSWKKVAKETLRVLGRV